MNRTRAIAAVSASFLARATPVVGQALVPVRMGAYPTDSYAEPFYGLDSGIFKRAGLDVALTVAVNPIQALVAGALDIGIGDVIQVANPVNAGVDLGIFAGGGLALSEAPTTLFCVAKNGSIRVAKDLEGQTIGVVLIATLSSMAAREWMRQNGVDLDKVRLVEIPFSSMTAALERGTVAAAMVAEPFLSDARNDLRVLGNAYDTVSKAFYISTFMAQRTWLTANPDVARRLRQALYDTARWANTHRDDSAPILAKFAKLELERVRSMTRSSFATSLDERRMQPVLDIAFRYKQLAKPVNAGDLIAKL